VVTPRGDGVEPTSIPGAEEILARVADRLVASFEPRRTLSLLPSLLVPELADWCAVVLPPVMGRAEWWRCPGPSRPTEYSRMSLRSLRRVPALEAAMDGVSSPGDGELVGQLAAASWGPGESLDSVGDVVVYPLAGVPARRAALVLVRETRRGRFDVGDLEVIRRFGALAGVALAAGLANRQQQRIISVLQEPLLPRPLPPIEGVEFAAFFRPGQRMLDVSGDFYDVRADGDGRALLVVGDVCGHGIEAAVLGGRYREAVHALAGAEHRPAHLLDMLNKTMLDLGDTRFATVVMGQLRPEPGGGVALTLSSGGHPRPLVLRSDGHVEEVTIPGTLVGVLPDAHFGEAEIVLAPGETMVLYSDGLAELLGGREEAEGEGVRQVHEVLTRLSGLDPVTAASELEIHVQGFAGEADHDDATALFVRAARTEPGR
jgi:serine phosphatase RsbU (regulator of sigma subunit)